MKKLEDIPKKIIFEVPEGYFDKLPGVIQARIEATKREPIWRPYVRFGLRYAMPALVLAAAALLYVYQPPTYTAAEMLARLDSQDLVSYLVESDLTTDDLLESGSLDEVDADNVQENTFTEMNFDDVDMEKLSDELGVDYY